MRILHSKLINQVANPKIVAVWGNGLIGQAICTALTRDDELEIISFPFDWKNEVSQQPAALTIGKMLETLVLAVCDKSKPRLIFVWSAGQAGFSATLEDTTQEMKAFNIVLGLAKKLNQWLKLSCVEFHLVSSAGGLFAGCNYVQMNDSPHPSNQYGQLKFEQEQALLSVAEIVPYIYRVASVYGIPGHGKRSSLISVLLKQGILRQVVTIVGTPITLRDYVHVDDIGNYIAGKIIYPELESAKVGLFWLISGKPSAIIEVKSIVEELIRHRLYLSYKLDPINSCNIVFSPHLKPVDFTPLPLRVGISQIHNHRQEFI